MHTPRRCSCCKSTDEVLICTITVGGEDIQSSLCWGCWKDYCSRHLEEGEHGS